MYISPEMHDIICEMGIWTCGIMLGTIVLAYLFPWLWRKTRFAREVLEIKLAYVIGMAILKHRRRVERRRYKAAMKVFDKPLTRWSDDAR